MSNQIKKLGENSGKEQIKKTINELIDKLNFFEIVIQEVVSTIDTTEKKINSILSPTLSEKEKKPAISDHGAAFPHEYKSEGWCYEIRTNPNGSISRYLVKCAQSNLSVIDD